MNEILKPDKTLSKVLPHQKLQQNIRYVPSQFAVQFEHEDKKYVFHNLTKQCLETALPASTKAGEGFDSLIEQYFLVPEGYDECAFYESIVSLLRICNRKKGVHAYTILPTLGCNARCPYCYEEGCKPVFMTPEIVEQTIRYIINTHSDEVIKLSWFGGEPILGQKVIDRICEGLRENGLEYKSFMISNGSLITPEIIEKMVGPWHMKGLQISMDGAENDYIIRKNYVRKADQYHTVIRNIELMTQKGISVQIRCNIDEENLKAFPVFLEDLKAGISQRENVVIYLAPLFQIQNDEKFLAIINKMIGFMPLIEQAGFLTGSMNSFSRTFRPNYCIADGNGVVICPDGVLSPCEHLLQDAGFGDIWHGVTDEASRKEFCRADRTRKKCRTCPFLPDCTSFASCPIRSSHCRETREMITKDALRRMVQNRNTKQPAESPVC